MSYIDMKDAKQRQNQKENEAYFVRGVLILILILLFIWLINS